MCFFSSRRRHTRYWRDWSSDVCSSDLSGRRSSKARPAHVHGQRELVELGALLAGELTLVLGALALLEALEDLALAAGVAQGGAAGVDLGLEAVQGQRPGPLLALGRVDPGLLGAHCPRGPLRGRPRAGPGGGG